MEPSDFADAITRLEHDLLNLVETLPLNHPIRTSKQPIYAMDFRRLILTEGATNFHPILLSSVLKRVPPYGLETCVDVNRWVDEARRTRSSPQRRTLTPLRNGWQNFPRSPLAKRLTSSLRQSASARLPGTTASGQSSNSATIPWNNTHKLAPRSGAHGTSRSPSRGRSASPARSLPEDALSAAAHLMQQLNAASLQLQGKELGLILLMKDKKNTGRLRVATMLDVMFELGVQSPRNLALLKRAINGEDEVPYVQWIYYMQHGPQAPSLHESDVPHADIAQKENAPPLKTLSSVAKVETTTATPGLKAATPAQGTAASAPSTKEPTSSPAPLSPIVKDGSIADAQTKPIDHTTLAKWFQSLQAPELQLVVSLLNKGKDPKAATKNAVDVQHPSEMPSFPSSPDSRWADTSTSCEVNLSSPVRAESAGALKAPVQLKEEGSAQTTTSSRPTPVKVTEAMSRSDSLLSSATEPWLADAAKLATDTPVARETAVVKETAPTLAKDTPLAAAKDTASVSTKETQVAQETALAKDAASAQEIHDAKETALTPAKDTRLAAVKDAASVSTKDTTSVSTAELACTKNSGGRTPAKDITAWSVETSTTAATLSLVPDIVNLLRKSCEEQSVSVQTMKELANVITPSFAARLAATFGSSTAKVVAKAEPLKSDVKKKKKGAVKAEITEEVAKKKEQTPKEDEAKKEKGAKKETVAKKEDGALKEDEAEKEDGASQEEAGKKEDAAKKEEAVKREESAAKKEEAAKKEVVEKEEEGAKKKESVKKEAGAKNDEEIKNDEAGKKEETVKKEETGKKEEAVNKEQGAKNDEAIKNDEAGKKEETVKKEEAVNKEQGAKKEETVKKEEEATKDANKNVVPCTYATEYSRSPLRTKVTRVTDMKSAKPRYIESVTLVEKKTPVLDKFEIWKNTIDPDTFSAPAADDGFSGALAIGLRLSTELRSPIKWVSAKALGNLKAVPTHLHQDKQQDLERMLQLPPRLFYDILPSDIAQGAVGNCGFVAAVAALAEFPHIIALIFERVANEYEGTVELALYDPKANFAQTLVELNDKVPVFSQNPKNSAWVDWKPCFVRNVRNESWPYLVEKAVAKLLGSYANLNGIPPCLAWAILSGRTSYEVLFPWKTKVPEVPGAEEQEDKWGIGYFESDLTEYSYSAPEENCMSANEVWQKLKTRVSESICACSFRALNNSDGTDAGKGLVAYHPYSLIALEEIEDIRLLRFRNPWGDERAWTGAWSNYSEDWDKHPRVMLQLNQFWHECQSDGLFYMSFKDFAERVHDVVYGIESLGRKLTVPKPFVGVTTTAPRKTTKVDSFIQHVLSTTRKGIEQHHPALKPKALYHILCRDKFRDKGIDKVRFFVIVNRFNPFLTETQLEAVWQHCDRNKTGYLDFDKFIQSIGTPISTAVPLE